MDYQHLISPHNGATLRPAGAPLSEGARLLTDGDLLWPVIDGIAYLRPKHELREKVVSLLWMENVADARRLLLRDQDRFSPTAPPDASALDTLLDPTATHTLREAMQLLNYGPVGDYFAYRWCTPTYLSGLILLGKTVRPDQPVVEFACGIGHFVRALEQEGFGATGVDIVFSKLWLARHYLGVQGPLICGDIEAGPVLRRGPARTVFCHDAFYFFEQKTAALRHMRSVAGAGNLAIGHVHTQLDAHEAGFSASLERYRLLTDSKLCDDTDAARQWYGVDYPLADAREDCAAIGWIEGETNARRVEWGSSDRGSLRLSPLIGREGISYPSDGWCREYEADCAELPNFHLQRLTSDDPLVDGLRSGMIQPEQLRPADRQTLYRKRVLVDLPSNW